MGLFLSAAGIASTSYDEVEVVLEHYAQQHDGQFAAIDDSADDPHLLVLAASPHAHVTVLYPDGLVCWDDVSAFLSQQLQRAVFSFHIHDGDLWLYHFYRSGSLIDRFNPLPDYWSTTVSETERRQWAGNAQILAENWPNLSAERIGGYLTPWRALGESLYGRKVHADDQYGLGDEWQLVDFMDKLGLVYPDDQMTVLRERRYRFIIPNSGRALAAEQRRSSWWKFWAI